LKRVARLVGALGITAAVSMGGFATGAASASGLSCQDLTNFVDQAQSQVGTAQQDLTAEQGQLSQAENVLGIANAALAYAESRLNLLKGTSSAMAAEQAVISARVTQWEALQAVQFDTQLVDLRQVQLQHAQADLARFSQLYTQLGCGTPPPA